MEERGYWIKHLFWLLGKMYINFLKGDIRSGKDSFNWIKLHVSYKGKLVGYNPPPFWQRVKVDIVTSFGLLFTIFLIFIIIKSFSYWL